MLVIREKFISILFSGSKMLNYLLGWKALRKTVLAASLLFGLSNCGADAIGSYKTADETESKVYDAQETILDLKTDNLDSIEEHLYQDVPEDISPDVACMEKIYYKDKDNDGYPKHSEDFKILCAGEEIPNGYIAENSWDCDDNNPEIHPDAIEICDYLDNDCDGKTDEGVTINSWKDKDGDGQGDKTNQSPENCEILEGYVTNPLDCNDYDKNILQSALELCDNKDNDCDGKIDEEFNVGQACSSGTGACTSSGSYQCTAD